VGSRTGLDDVDRGKILPHLMIKENSLKTNTPKINKFHLNVKEVALGRTTGLLSFDTTRTSQKTTKLGGHTDSKVVLKPPNKN
jgi:hypothetical protein